MKRECIGTGKTVDEAIENACRELGCTREEIDFEIVNLAKKSFFGLKVTPAKVMVTYEDGKPAPQPAQEPVSAAAPAAPVVPTVQKPAAKEERPSKQTEAPKQPVQEPKPVKEAPQEPKAAPALQPMPAEVQKKADAATAYLSGILEQMGVTGFQLLPKYKENGTLVLQISGGDLGGIIGRRGETLDALQYLTGLACNRGEGEYLRVNLDSGNYREKRTRTLENLAYREARKAVRTGRSITLEPMNPYDRRIIHAAVSRVEGAQSTSVGVEPNRRVVISSTNPEQAVGSEERQGSYRSRRGGRSGGKGRRTGRPAGTSPEQAGEKAAAPKKTAPLTDAADKPLYGKIEL